MRWIIPILLSIMPVFGQGAAGVVIMFSPQPPVGSFDAYSAVICNSTTGPINFHSAIVRNAATAEGLRPASYSTINRELATRKRMSPVRILASIAEVAGWGMSVAVATEAIWKQHSALQKTLPTIVAGSLRLATTITAQYNPEQQTPDDLLPVFIQVPAGLGSCVEYTMLANP
ncbi:MAG TPA: hypothetical protein VFI02_16530 [Armatimonadota bacterium]|nr:hypothetical protein [Armatimonadota bacterium]